MCIVLILECQKQLPKLSKTAFIVSSMMSPLMLLRVLVVAQHESGSKRTISWSMTVYNKTYTFKTIWLLK